MERIDAGCGRRRGAGWLALLLAAWCTMARAGIPEFPRLDQLTVAEGLPSNTVNDLAEDRAGYLWIATSDGLARYDGVGFRVWRDDDGLHSNEIASVLVDARDRVWIGTVHSGLAVLDASRTGIVRRPLPGLGTASVTTLATTRDGAVWAGTSGAGLYRIAPDGRVDHFLPHAGGARGMPAAQVRDIVAARDGTLWIATERGLARWTPRGIGRVPFGAAPQEVTSLALDSDDSVWIAAADGVWKRAPDGRIERGPWKPHHIYSVLIRDRSGDLWMDSQVALARDIDGIAYSQPLYSPASRGGVLPTLTTAHQDRQGGLWFGSAGHGLWTLSPRWRQFAALSHRAGDATTPFNGGVLGIGNASDGRMWLVGTTGVLERLDPETGQIDARLDAVNDGSMLVDVLQDRRGTVWVVSDTGLMRARGNAMTRWDMNAAVDPLPALTPTTLAEDTEGMIWVTLSQGHVQRRDGDGTVLDSLAPGDGRGLPTHFLPSRARSGPNGALWLAGSHGLLQWNAGTRRFDPLPGAPGTLVSDFTVLGNDRVWATVRGALLGLRWDGERLVQDLRIDTRDGMPLLVPSGLVADVHGIVWVTTKRGLLRVDPVRRSVQTYGVRNGLPNQEFAFPPVAREGDGRILIGHPDGVIVFDPAVVGPLPANAPLVLETVEVIREGRRVALNADGPLVLQPGDRQLRVVARLLAFDNARSHRYRFRLAGRDRDWIEAADGERVFAELEAGRYRFEATARTADGEWGPVRAIAVTVLRPWWRTWPALAGFGASAVLLAWWTVSTYRARLRRKQEWLLAQRERELARQASLAKTRFLATLGHEVRTPMTGVLGMSELLLATSLDARQRGYADAIRRAGEHLLRLVNDALDLARIESGRLELAAAPFDLRRVLDDAVALMRPLAERKGLAFAVAIDDDAPVALRGDASRVSQIVLNLLSNAIKFTEEGRVALCVAALAPGVRIEIADSGPGLNDEQKARLFRRFEQAEGARTAARYGGSGLGLAICQELAGAMGGRIDVDSVPGAGTTFRVDLPFPEATLDASPTPVEPRAPPSATASRSVLLVEDDPTVAEVVVGLLHAQGHRVAHAPHGLAAMAEAATQRFDIALLDLDLPGLDGFAVAAQLRAQGFASPIVAVTARADGEAEPEVHAAGFDGFLRKPLTGDMLATTIERALARPPAG